MLNEMRSGATGFFVKLLLGLLVVMFVFWGIHGVDFATGEPVATVGDQRIDIQQFDREVSVLKRNFGAELTGGKGALVQLMKLALNDMIGRRLLAQEAERNDLLISDDVLAVQIGKDNTFQGAAGDFDKAAFQQRLRENNLTESQYLQQLAAGMQQSLLLKMISGHSLVPKGYAAMLYGIENETRSIDLIAVSAALDAAAPSPSDEQIAGWYAQHKASFQAPEYRRLGIVRLDPKTVEASVKVEREEVFSLFNQRRESLMIPEKRDVMQLLYSTKADAENAYAMLRSGRTVNEVSKQIAPADREAIALGYVTKEQIPAGGDSIFALARGEYTQPIESPFGWHVFLVKDIRERHPTDFDEVKKTLEEEVRQKKAETLLSDTTQRLDDAVAGTNNLADAAKEAGLPYVHTVPVDAGGKDEAGNVVLLASDRELLETAFQLTPGDRSDLMRSGNGLYVVKVESTMPPRQRELNEVRNQVVEGWSSESRVDSTKARAEALASELRGAAPERRAALLAARGIEVKRGVIVRRDGTASGIDEAKLPAALVADIFASNIGQPTSAHRFEDKEYALAFVDRSIPAASEGEKEGVQALSRSLDKSYDNEISAQYLAQLRQRFPVRINEALLNDSIERR